MTLSSYIQPPITTVPTESKMSTRASSRAPAARKVVKLGYGQDEAELEPMLVNPLHVPALEPTDAEILELRLGTA